MNATTKETSALMAASAQLLRVLQLEGSRNTARSVSSGKSQRGAIVPGPPLDWHGADGSFASRRVISHLTCAWYSVQRASSKLDCT